MNELLLEVFKKSRSVDRDTLLTTIYTIGDIINEGKTDDNLRIKIHVEHLIEVAERREKERKDKMINISIDEKQAILLKFLIQMEMDLIDDDCEEYDYTERNVKGNMYRSLNDIINQLKDIEEYNDRVDVIEEFEK
ncbi:hypothetical protein HMPREF1142_2213 [Peptostreptococcaceae bacterium AS15]|nr:hypothetical protein HMPREF1142_2213 [Peptostreptococcaceae bacterium AS15]